MILHLLPLPILPSPRTLSLTDFLLILIFFQPLLPIRFSIHQVITTQPQYISIVIFPDQALFSSIHYPQPSLTILQNSPLNTLTTLSNTNAASYDPHASLHSGFHNYPQPSFPHHLHPNHLPPSFSTYPITHNPSEPTTGFSNEMTSFVQLAAFSVHINLSDGLDYTYPSEKFFTHLSARITFFKLGPQRLDIQSYSPWHSRRMSLFYC